MPALPIVPISIHAAREGGDSASAVAAFALLVFQSTPPVKAATEETEEEKVRFGISIHAAREGGDLVTLKRVRSISDFNPRRP